MRKVLAFILIAFTVAACKHDLKVGNHIADQKDGVVAIFSNIPSKKETGLGTGFFIKENTIVTNYHVAGDPEKELKVGVENGEKMYDAVQVFGDKDADIAVIKLKNWEEFKKENPQVKYLKFAHEMPQVADVVYAVGHPWGLLFSVSKGIVSVDARKSPSEIPMWWVQTDAHVFQGNSGGPLLNEDGEVVGVDSVMIAKEGGSYGFAIPAPVVLKILNDLEKYKEVRWATLGISMTSPGVTVKDVLAGSAAQKAGIKVDDEIVGLYIDDHANGIAIDNSFTLIKELATLDYSTPITLMVKRKDAVEEILLNPGFKTAKDFVAK